MHINLFIIPFIIVVGLLFSKTNSKRGRSSYIVICSIVLILIASLRSPERMASLYSLDTMKYEEMFERSFDIGWNEFVHTFYLRYFMGIEDFDVGFTALNKIISYVTHEFWVFSVIADLLFFVPFGRIIYCYTTSVKQIMFAYVFYVALLQVFFLAGARQMFSLGFDLMALLAVVDRKLIRALIFFVIGLTIHFSSFLFLIPLIMIWYNIKPDTLKVLHALSFVIFPLVLFFPNQIIVFMGVASGVERYAEFGRRAIQGDSWMFIFLIELISLFCLIAIKKEILIMNNAIRVFYVMTPLLTFFAPLIISNGSMIRISLYFHMFLCLLIPYAIDCCLDENQRNTIYILAITALLVLTLSGGGTQYYFFWQR